MNFYSFIVYKQNKIKLYQIKNLKQIRLQNKYRKNKQNWINKFNYLYKVFY